MRDAIAQLGRRVRYAFSDRGERRAVYFVASPYKTATTTVGQALIRIGAARFQMRYRRGLLSALRPRLKRYNDLVPKDVGAAEWIAEHSEEMRTVFSDLLPVLGRYDVFHDAPLGHSHFHPFILKALVPEARFIWVNRPRRDWMDSVRRWETTHPDLYPNHDAWNRDPEARHRALRRFWQKRHLRFERLKADYPADCLEIDIAELASWERLAEFCDVPAPKGRPEARNVSRR